MIRDREWGGGGWGVGGMGNLPGEIFLLVGGNLTMSDFDHSNQLQI